MFETVMERAPEPPFELNTDSPLVTGLQAGTFFTAGGGPSQDILSGALDWSLGTGSFWTAGKGGIGVETNVSIISVPNPGIGGVGTLAFRFQYLSQDATFGRYFSNDGTENQFSCNNDFPDLGTDYDFKVANVNVNPVDAAINSHDGNVHTLIFDWDTVANIGTINTDGINEISDSVSFGTPSPGSNIIFGNRPALDRDIDAIWYFIAFWDRLLNASEKLAVAFNPAQLVVEPGRVTYSVPEVAAAVGNPWYAYANQ